MKKLFIFMSFFSIMRITTSKAQSSTVSFHIGPSMAVGDFALSEDLGGGGASTGRHTAVKVTRTFSNNVQMYARYFRNRNAHTYSPLHLNELNTSTGENWTVNSTAWRTTGWMIGVGGETQLDSLISLNATAGLGLISVFSPDILLQEDGPFGYWENVFSKKAMTIGGEIGAGISYQIKEKVKLKVDISYVTAKVSYNSYEMENSENEYYLLTGKQQKVGIVSAAIGLSLDF